MMTKRRYDNTTREEKRRRTRDAVVTTLAEAMAEGLDDLSVAEIAERSGVSRRTVYDYFPDKAARIRAIDEWINSFADIRPILPMSFDDVKAYVEQSVAYLFRYETHARVLMNRGLAKEVRSHRKRVHIRAIVSALSERIENRKACRELACLIVSLVRPEAVYDLRDVYGLSERRIRQRLGRMAALMIEEFVRANDVS